MSKLLALIFLACALSLPLTAEQNKVIVVEDVKDSDVSVFVREFDFRGKFLSLGVIIGDEFDLRRLRSRFAKDAAVVGTKGDRLWMLECGIAQCVSEVLPVLASLNVLYTSSSSMQWLVVGENVHEIDFSRFATLVSVSETALVAQPPPSLASNLASSFDQRVFDLLALVTKDGLYNTVDYLSNTWNSRMSTTPEAASAQKWLVEQYTALGLEVSEFPFRESYASDVIAELPGAEEPEKIVFIGGHFDSRSVNISDPKVRAPGADDNGSGSAAVLEAAKAVMASGLKFKYTIRFCAWAGEEQGLVGSRAYAAQMREEGQEVIAVVNGDMLGYRLPNTDIVVGMKDRYTTPWLLSVVNTITAHYVPTLGISTSPSCCSDHQAFFENGYPAVGFFENPGNASSYPNYHTSGDVIDNIDFDQHRLICQAMLASVATFASIV